MTRRLAMFKLGSSTFRVTVYELERESVRVLHTAKAVTALGAGYSVNRLIDEAAVMQALSVLCEQIEAYRPCQRVAVATGLFRLAGNSVAVIRAIEQLLGGHVIVATEAEEVEMTRMSVRRTLGHDQFILIDIGGGTTEVSVPGGRQTSLHLGTMSVIDSQSDLLMPTPAGVVLRLSAKVQRVLAMQSLPPRGEMPVVGVGSSFVSLLHIGHRAPTPTSGSLRLAEIQAAIEELGPLSYEERCRVDGVDGDRAHLIIPGAIIAYEILANLGVESAEVRNVSTADGMLLWLLAREQEHANPWSDAETV